MGMSMHVVGLVPPDSEYQTKLAAWRACEAAKVEPPKELYEYFGIEWGTGFHYSPDPKGRLVELEPGLTGGLVPPCVAKYRDDEQEGLDVDVTRLPPNVKVVRFYCSW